MAHLRDRRGGDRGHRRDRHLERHGRGNPEIGAAKRHEVDRHRPVAMDVDVDALARPGIETIAIAQQRRADAGSPGGAHWCAPKRMRSRIWSI